MTTRWTVGIDWDRDGARFVRQVDARLPADVYGCGQ